MIKVAITSPSLESAINISGIANHTKLVINNASQTVKYSHIIIGKKDAQKRNIFWFLKQVNIVFNFFKKIRPVDIVHLNVPLAHLSIIINIVLVLLAKVSRKKIIIHFRGGELGFQGRHNFWHRISISILIKLSSSVIFLGVKEKQYFLDNYKILRYRNAYALPNAVNVPLKAGDEKHCKFSNSRIDLVYFGRMDHSKGLKEIALALELLVDNIDFHFHAIGDGPDLESFEKNLNSRSLTEYVTIHGSKTQGEIFDILSKCQIFILPSHFEGLPNSLLEAMAHHVVPVVTPVGSIPEVVVPGNNGFMVQVKCPEELAETIIFAKNNEVLLADMANRGHLLMERKFSIKSYCASLDSIYNETID